MCSVRKAKPVYIGVLADEPIRIAGLASIFEQPEGQDQIQLIPVFGRLDTLLDDPRLDYLLLDLNISMPGVETMIAVRRNRPALRMIVIGPEGNDEIVMESIIAGARAYLDLTAEPETLRQAIEVVTTGSIWAPRRILTKLIDRLLATPEATPSGSGNIYLTVRERQVLDLILAARPNREIARELGIEERTVKAHVASLMRKTGSENRIELSMRAINLSLSPLVNRA